MPLEKEAESVPARVLSLVPRAGPPAPDPSVVEYLATLLKEAKSGRLRTIAYVALYTDVTPERSYAGMNESAEQPAIALGSLDVLMAEIRESFFPEDND